jgi:Phospholipase_D-nuclease N-terminal
MLGEYWGGGFFVIVGLVLMIWAVVHIAQSSAAPMGKAIWIVAVCFLPYIGFVIWLLFGPRAPKRAS